MPEKDRSQYEGKTAPEPMPDEVIERVIKDPANPEVKRLTGFLMGRSDKDGYWRLYLNVDLDHYIEFRKEDTLHAQQFRPASTVVWLKSDARVIEKIARSGSVEFLQGGLLRDYVRRYGPNFAGLLAGPRMRLMAADGSTCAHTGCSAGCTPGYGCGGGGDTIGYTCGC